MSANELIREVAALSPRERALFVELLQAMQNGTAPAKPSATQGWPDFQERLARIYGDKTVADSESIIDEGRGNR